MSDSSYEWKDGSRLTMVLVDRSGRIIGEVKKANDTGYNASVSWEALGTYYTEAQAKKAVENKARKWLLK